MHSRYVPYKTHQTSGLIPFRPLVDKGLLLLEMTDELVSYKKCCQEIIRFFPEVLEEENFMRKKELLK